MQYFNPEDSGLIIWILSVEWILVLSVEYYKIRLKFIS